MRSTRRVPILLSFVLLLPSLPVPSLAGRRQVSAGELPGTGAIRAAIMDLAASFPDGYRDSAAHLERLARIEREARGPGDARSEGDRTAPSRDLAAILADLEALRRDVVVSNPLVSGRPILFVVRRQYRPDHHNTETMFQTGEINTGSFRRRRRAQGASTSRRGGEARTLLDAARRHRPRPRRALRRPTDPLLHAARPRGRLPPLRDERRRHRPAPAHLRPRRLPTSTRSTCPTAGIVFTSTREPKYCMCNRHIMGNLFRMDARRGEHPADRPQHAPRGPRLAPARRPHPLRPLGVRGPQLRRRPGRSGPSTPTARTTRVYWGNNTALARRRARRPRRFPARDLVIATFSSCHDRPWGALAIVDRRLGHRRPSARSSAPGRPTRSTWCGDGRTTTRSRGVHPEVRGPLSR